MAPLEIREIVNQRKNMTGQSKVFESGKDWKYFLEILNDEKIKKAENSLKQMLEVEDLKGRTFLDIGSGNGLFSLAARRLGAKVHSFEFDLSSYSCSREMRRRYFPADENWRVEQGSVLDRKYIESLGKFDIVFSWGALHHTGKIWEALENAKSSVAKGGKLFIAICNDSRKKLPHWKIVKKTYSKLPKFMKNPYTALVFFPIESKQFISSLITLKPAGYFRSWTQYDNNHGMNRWYDMVDWVGGGGYEFAASDEILEFFKAKGYRLKKMIAKNVEMGCNQFVFQKE